MKLSKRFVAAFMAVLLVGLFAAETAQAGSGRGGPLGLVIGCCFGARTAAAYNEGKTLHWRDWGSLIPVFSIVVWVMDGIDGYQGVTTQDYAEQYGSQFF